MLNLAKYIQAVVLGAAVTVGVLSLTAHAGIAAEFNLAVGYHINSSPGTAAQTFVKELNLRTPRTKVRIVASGAMAREHEIPAALTNGVIDLAVAVWSVPKTIPEFGVFDIPFLFKDRNHLKNAADVMLPAVLNSISERNGFIVLGVFDFGRRHIASTSNPIRGAEDLKGMRVRTYGLKWTAAMFKSYGSVPVALPIGEVYEALNRGVIEAQETSLASMVSLRTYRATKYLSLTDHSFNPGYLLMSMRAWNKLSRTEKRNFREAAQATTASVFAATERTEQKALNTVSSTGIKINKVPWERFAKTSYRVYDWFAREVPSGSKLISMALSAGHR